ncbi:MAG TPA: hypothetical protein VFM64_02020 [Candidatus Nitrosotenuis sp.]|nr:hypothetical protein [Candidatus Nitrosotenuis sp.]
MYEKTSSKITVSMNGDNDLKSTPPHIVLHQPGDVEFYNDTPKTLTISLEKEGVVYPGAKSVQTISAEGNSKVSWAYTDPGSYRWSGKVLTIIDDREYELNTGGAILVLADDMSSLSKREQHPHLQPNHGSVANGKIILTGFVIT